MSFQVGIGSLGGTVFFSGGTLYPSVNYGNLLLIYFFAKVTLSVIELMFRLNVLVLMWLSVHPTACLSA